MALDLTTKTMRRRLRRRHGPHWQRIAVGRALGYRRSESADAGAWYVRVRTSKPEGDPYRWKALGTADDLPHDEADGEKILDYAQALAASRRWDPFADPSDEAPDDELTIASAMRRYLDWFEAHRRSVQQTRNVIEGQIIPKLGKVPLDRLTARGIRRWHEAIASEPPGRRTGKTSTKPKRQKGKPAELTSDQQRRRKATANRVLGVLKAGLNQALDELLHTKRPAPEFRERLVISQHALASVKSFENVDRPRTRHLDGDEAKRLVNACEPDFRNLVLSALYTGCRWGELTSLRVADLRFEVGGVYIAESKSGNPRVLYLNDEAIAFFESMVAGRDGDELVFLRADGKSWGDGQQARRIRAACEIAKLKPRVVFHELRHTYASLYLMAGGGLPDLAKQLGHGDTRMVERYSHFAEQWRAERAQRFAPSLGIKPSKKTRRLRRKA